MVRVPKTLLLVVASAAAACSTARPSGRTVAAPPAVASPSATPAPALQGGATAQELPAGLTWLNAGGANSLASLRGQVVYVQFAFLG